MTEVVTYTKLWHILIDKGMRKKDLQNTQRFKKEYEEFEGFVYCVEVPSHKIVVRSEGYTFISGNCHHLSERCRESIQHYDYKNAILLSATVKHNLKQELYRIFKFETIKVSTREAIENDTILEYREDFINKFKILQVLYHHR